MAPGVVQHLPQMLCPNKILRQRKPGPDQHRPRKLSAASTRNVARQCQCMATMPEMKRPRNPPSTVPATYDDMARPTPRPAHSSLTYASITAITPGTKMPCAKRQKISMRRLVEVAASAVGIVSRKSEGTITFLRPRRSAIIPMKGAAIAVAKMVALTVKLTCNSEA